MTKQGSASLRRAFAGVGVVFTTLVVLALAGAVFVSSGVYSVAADQPHSRTVHAFSDALTGSHRLGRA